MKFQSILEAIRYHAGEHPDKIALIDKNGEITYSEYFRRICGTARYLTDRGVKAGDRVIAVNAQNIDFLTLCHGVQLMGGMFVPLEKNAAPARVSETAAKTEAVLFVGNAAVDSCPSVKLSECVQSRSESIPRPLPEPAEESMILFTTGTTGSSKGIVLTYGSEVSVAENVKYGVEMGQDNVEIIPMPVNHSFALRRYFANMINGSTVILLDGVIFVNLFFQMLERYKATAVAMAPAALSIIFKLSGDRLGDYDGKLDYIQFGSSPLPEEDKARLLRLLPDCRLYNIYGTTEAGCSTVLNFNSSDNRPHCIGRPTCNSHFKVVDENGAPVQATRENPGYLYCAGGMCMKGYYGEPELTAEVMDGEYILSRDLSYVDENGLIYMLGRADDVINTGGNKVSPAEVEEVARRFPGVTDCACVPVKDPLLGQVPKLFVSAKEKLEVRDLYQFLAENLEKHKLPKSIETIDEIPRTYNGKLWRAKLAER